VNFKLMSVPPSANRRVFSARQHIAYMLSALYAMARLSIRPSIRLSHSHGWIMQKRLKLAL